MLLHLALFVELHEFRPVAVLQSTLGSLLFFADAQFVGVLEISGFQRNALRLAVAELQGLGSFGGGIETSLGIFRVLEDAHPIGGSNFDNVLVKLFAPARDLKPIFAADHALRLKVLELYVAHQIDAVGRLESDYSKHLPGYTGGNSCSHLVG